MPFNFKICMIQERGGRINYHHSEIICGRNGFYRNLAAFPRDIPPKDISEEALAEKDKEYYFKK